MIVRLVLLVQPFYLGSVVLGGEGRGEWREEGEGSRGYGGCEWVFFGSPLWCNVQAVRVDLRVGLRGVVSARRVMLPRESFQRVSSLSKLVQATAVL